MTVYLVIIFLATYLAVIFEQRLRINKSASVLVGAGLLWSVYSAFSPNAPAELNTSLSSTAQVVFFLLSAMTIVEVIDAHDGFQVVTSRISTTRITTLLWLIGIITFFLSAVLDNMTTAIVMVSLMRKLLDQKEDRLFFAGIIVIAANAGGAWTPIGDVTTTMLWIGGRITTLAIMKGVFIPSFINLIIPLLVVSYQLRGKRVIAPETAKDTHETSCSTPFERKFMFFLGVGILCAVPVFKALTGLPPFMGILFGLGILWLSGEFIHRRKNDGEKQNLTLTAALHRIDMASVVFFIGILLAVAALEHAQILSSLAFYLERLVGRQSIIVFLLGLASAVVDNVPLAAASMGMYPLAQFPTDSFLWEFLAYAVGTGGSIFIIGSAAGVAAMGIEKIEFFWYARKISLLAFSGYAAGAIAYVLVHH